MVTYKCGKDALRPEPSPAPGAIDGRFTCENHIVSLLTISGYSNTIPPILYAGSTFWFYDSTLSNQYVDTRVDREPPTGIG